MENYEVVHTFQKNIREQVQVALGTFHGVDLIDLRVFYLDVDEEWQPSKKGIAVRVEQLDDLELAISKVRDALMVATETKS